MALMTVFIPEEKARVGPAARCFGSPEEALDSTSTLVERVLLSWEEGGQWNSGPSHLGT